MPQYRVLEKSYLPDGTKTPDGTPTGGCRIYEAGETVNYDGLPSGNLEPLDDEGKAKQVAYQASLVQLRAERAAASPDDTTAIAEKVAGILEGGFAKALAAMGEAASVKPAKAKA